MRGNLRSEQRVGNYSRRCANPENKVIEKKQDRGHPSISKLISIVTGASNSRTEIEKPACVVNLK
jgi:hypothetical protein